MTGFSKIAGEAMKEKQEKEKVQREKRDNESVTKLLVNTDLPPERIAEITGTSTAYVKDKNEKLQR